MSESDGGFRELMRLVRAGDQAATSALVRRYEPVLSRMIRVRLADPRLRRTLGDSDIFQSVMGSFLVRASLGQYDLHTPADLLKLLATMTRNKVADQARRRDAARDAVPHTGVEEALVDPGASPSHIIALRDLAEKARAQLDPELLEVLALRDDGLGWKEVAATLGGEPDAWRKRLSRAIDEVAGRLELDRGS